MSEKQNGNSNLNNIIDLSTASQETGYHQNYLSLLCRQGILKAFKAGRNWLIAREDLDGFVQNHQNGISEAVDEEGNKIPVHLDSQNKPNTQRQSFGDKNIVALPNAGPKNAGSSSPQKQNIISLSKASRATGYHQDYLAFLCRTGKLRGLKIGRNWVTTESDLDDFIKNYKNGISEVQDETGNKIPVHITHAAPEFIPQAENLVAANNLTPPPPTANPKNKMLSPVTAAQAIPIQETFLSAPAVASTQSLDNANLTAQTSVIEPPPHLELNKLKQSVFTDLEQRISKHDDSIAVL